MCAVGQFDQDNANILHHGHDHFAEVFRLRFFMIAEFQFIELGNPIYQFGYGLTKLTAN